jgi:hypothetical protein
LGNVRRGYPTFGAFEHGLVLPFGEFENLKPFWKALDSEIIAFSIRIFSGRNLYVTNFPAKGALDRFGDVVARGHAESMRPDQVDLGIDFELVLRHEIRKPDRYCCGESDNEKHLGILLVTLTTATRAVTGSCTMLEFRDRRPAGWRPSIPADLDGMRAVIIGCNSSKRRFPELRISAKVIFWAALAWPMIALIRAGVKPLPVGALRIMGNKTPAPGAFDRAPLRWLQSGRATCKVAMRLPAGCTTVRTFCQLRFACSY